MANNNELSLKEYYQETRAQHRHLSYIIYFTLGFFITITAGWFKVIQDNINNADFVFIISKLIGILLLILLLMQAKVSRSSYDNRKIFSKLHENVSKNYKWSSSSPEGINDFLMYAALTWLTVFVYSYNPNNVPLSSSLRQFFSLFILIYYILAGGKFIKTELSSCSSFCKLTCIVLITFLALIINPSLYLSANIFLIIIFIIIALVLIHLIYQMYIKDKEINKHYLTRKREQELEKERDKLQRFVHYLILLSLLFFYIIPNYKILTNQEGLFNENKNQIHQLYLKLDTKILNLNDLNLEIKTK